MIFLYLSVIHISAQGQLNHELYGIEEGLNNRNVQFVSRDHQDNIWMVTSKVEMYDGNRFYSFDQIKEIEVNDYSLIVAGLQFNDSLIYLLDYKNIFSFNTNTKQYELIEFPEQLSKQAYTFHNFVQSLYSEDILFFSRLKEEFYFHLVGPDWKRILTHQIPSNSSGNNIASMYSFGKEGEMWFMYVNENMVLRIEENHKDTFAISFPEKSNHIVVIPRESAFLISGTGKIRKLDFSGKVEDWISLPSGLGPIKAKLINRDGKLYMLFKRKFYEIDLRNQSYKEFDHRFFINEQSITRQIMEDREGIKWVASELGLLKINADLKPFQSGVKGYATQNNIQFREIIATDDPQSVIARMNDGGRGLLKISFKPDNTVDTTMLFYPVGGTGEMHGYKNTILHLNNNRNYAIAYDLTSLSEYKITLPYSTSSEYNNQSLLIGNVLHYTNSDYDIVRFNLESKSTELVDLMYGEFNTSFGNKCLEYIPNKYYITGTLKSGILIHDATNGKLIKHFHMDSEPALSNNQITSISVQNDSVLWAGTLGGGLNKIDIENNTIQHFTKEDGLPNNRIASLQMDDDQNLWLGTYDGLSKYNISQNKFYNFYEEDGIANNEFNYLASLKDKNGIIYFGTFNGITKFDPSLLIETQSLPPVRITSVSKYNPKLDSTLVSSSTRRKLEHVRLKSFENSLNIEFGVPSYKNTVAYHYQIKLEGLNENWLDLGPNYTFLYPKLPAGNYNLLVKANLPNGVSTNQDTKLKIKVDEVFYRRWWFIILLFMSILGVFYLIYHARINMLKQENEVRSRIASDLHDEIGSSMTRISLQLQMFSTNISGEKKKNLEKIEHVVDLAIGKLRDLVWSIDMGSDSWQDMMDKMEDYAFDTLLARDVQFILKPAEIQLSKMIKPLVKRNLYLIFKEAVNNAAKHSDGNSVTCHLINENKRFTMIIVDNGKSSGTISNGNGLQNLEMRAERLKGTLSHGFISGGGFKVELKLPYEV